MLGASRSMAGAKGHAIWGSSNQRWHPQRILILMRMGMFLMLRQVMRSIWRRRKHSSMETSELLWPRLWSFSQPMELYARPSTWDVYQAMIRIAEKKMSKAELAAIFRQTAGQQS